MDNCLRCSIKRAVCSTLNQTLTLRGWITFSFSSSLKRLTKWQTTTEKQYVPTLHFWCRYIKTVQSCQNISPVSQWSDKHIFWHKSCHSGFVKSYMCYALHIDQTVKSCYSFEWHVSKQWHVKQMASSIKCTSIKTASDSLWEWHWLWVHFLLDWSNISVYNIQIDHHMISMQANSFPPIARKKKISEAKWYINI